VILLYAQLTYFFRKISSEREKKTIFTLSNNKTNNIMKHLFTLLMALVPMVMSAEEIPVVQGCLTFKINTETKTAKLSSCDKEDYPESITIPQTIEYEGKTYPVTEPV
jgi:hypothetical protein